VRANQENADPTILRSLCERYNLRVNSSIPLADGANTNETAKKEDWRFWWQGLGQDHLIAFLICLLLGFIVTLPGSLLPRSVLFGYPGDNYQHAWFLWHFARAVSHAENPFYTNLIYYPNKVNLAWSTTDPLAGTLALPMSLSGPALAYNTALILQLALAAFFARLLCLRICRNEVAALVGGVVFGFSPFLLAHALGHLSLVTAFPIPLFVLVFDAVLGSPAFSWKLSLALGGALLLATMAHYNYTIFCCLVGLLLLAIEVFTEGKVVVVRRWKTFLVAAAVFLAGFLPLLKILLGGSAGGPIPRGYHHIDQFSADVLGFAIPSWNHILLGHFARSLDSKLFAAGFEGTVYVGPIVLALAILGAWKARHWQQMWVWRATILGFVFYLLSLGPKIHLLGHDLALPGPAALIYRLPFAQFISAPARFHVIVALCLAVLSSLGVAYLIERFSAPWQRHAILGIVAALLLLDYLTIPFPTSSIVDPAAQSDQPAAQACILPQEVSGGTVLTFPLVVAPYCMKSMWMQASDGGHFALIDGYLSYSPQATWTTFWHDPTVRSLLSLEGIINTPVDEVADRKTVQETIHGLNLKAFVVFDSPQREIGFRYGEQVFGVVGRRRGSCTVFDIAPTN
jgi:hypothetical protein